jgi:hypothetical protein
MYLHTPVAAIQVAANTTVHNCGYKAFGKAHDDEKSPQDRGETRFTKVINPKAF